MPKIIWDESFSVNHVEVDNQHKKWIEIINELHAALFEGKGLDTIAGKSLKAMVDYGKVHFTYEEGLMQKIHYPGLNEHRHIHSEFLQKLKHYQSKQVSDELVFNRGIMDELMNWLLDHILKEDQKYISYLSSYKD